MKSEMSQLRNVWRFIILLMLASILNACGNGSSNKNNGPASLGVLPNGSTVYVSSNNSPMTP